MLTRKREENNIKKFAQDQLNDTVRQLELDDGHCKEYSDSLTDRIKTLKDNIQHKLDSEETQKARKYMAKRNLEAETPTKAFCNQVNKAKKKTKLQCLLQERNLKQVEIDTNPQQKQSQKFFARQKLKNKSENSMADYTISNPQALTSKQF